MNSSFVTVYKEPLLDNFQENVRSVHESKVLTVSLYYHNIFVANQKCLFNAVECPNGYFIVTCNFLYNLLLTAQQQIDKTTNCLDHTHHHHVFALPWDA